MCDGWGVRGTEHCPAVSFRVGALLRFLHNEKMNYNFIRFIESDGKETCLVTYPTDLM